MLKEIIVPIDNLLLDPNNPRFIRDLGKRIHVPDDMLETKQEETLQHFSRKSKTDETDVTNIKDLYESMLRLGFVEIDRIVVRPAGKNGKYLVLEGNRRIATVKMILKDYNEGIIDEPLSRHDLEARIPSFQNINAMLLDTEGLSKEEIDHRVSVLLGIRHHGSLLEWEPLPRAFNIYTEYMHEAGTTKFKFDNGKAKEVANRLCIDRADVTDALRTYIVYLQVRQRFPEVKDNHFSLIESGIKDRFLKRGYFIADDDTFQFDEKSLTKLNQVCQFATRDSLPTYTKKKIIKDPKQFKLLGRLVDKMQQAKHPAIKAYAADLIRSVEDENDVEMILERAVDYMTAFENRTKWADAIAKLLDKQAASLPIESYKGDGNDRGNKEELKATLELIRRSMGL